MRTKMNNNSLIKAHIGMIIWAVIISFSFTALKHLTEGLPPMIITSVRFLLASAALMPFLFKEKKILKSRAELYIYSLMGLCLALFFGTMFWASSRTSPLALTSVYVSVPVLTYFLSRMTHLEKKTPGLIAILIAGAVGALLIASAESSAGNSFIINGKGEIVFFIGCVAISFYPILTKIAMNKKITSEKALVRTIWSLFTGSIILGIAGIFLESPSNLAKINSSDVLLLVYLGVISSGVTFWLLQNAAKVMAPAKLQAYSYLVPFITMIVSMITSSDNMNSAWIPGSLLIIISITAILQGDIRKIMKGEKKA